MNKELQRAKDEAAREKWNHIPPLDVEPDKYPTADDYIKTQNKLDNIHPQHYKGTTIQPIDLIDSLELGFYEGNIVKYVSRWKNKNGVEDLKKALFYLERLIEKEEKNGNRSKSK